MQGSLQVQWYQHQETSKRPQVRFYSFWSPICIVSMGVTTSGWGKGKERVGREGGREGGRDGRTDIIILLSLFSFRLKNITETDNCRAP